MKEISLKLTEEEAAVVQYAIDCAMGELIHIEDDELENLGFSKFSDLLLDIEYRLVNGSLQ